MSHAQCTTKTRYETRWWYEPYSLDHPPQPAEDSEDVTLDVFHTQYPFNPQRVDKGIRLPTDSHTARCTVAASEILPPRIAEREYAFKREMIRLGRALTEEDEVGVRIPLDEEEWQPTAGEFYSVDLPNEVCHSYFFGLGRTECTKRGEERFAVYAQFSTACTYDAGITPLPKPEELSALGLRQAIDPDAPIALGAIDLSFLQETLEEIAASAGESDAVEYEDIMAYGEDRRHPLGLGAYRLTFRNEGGSFEVDDQRIQIKMGLWKAIEASPMSPGGKRTAKAMIAGKSRIAHGPSGEGSFTGGVILLNATNLLRLGKDEDFAARTIDRALGTSEVEFFARSEPGNEEQNGRIEYFRRL